MVKTSSSEKIEYQELAQLPSVAQQVISFAGDLKIWAFEGEMGAGKTTLIKAICDILEVEDNVSSPTFSIVNEYWSAKEKSIYHFDFYRLKDESEALDIGIEEYFDSGNYCFLEWPSKIENLLPKPLLKIQITIEGNQRVIHLKKNS
jgi:tRNA threonylcarbamoyladenosine biosynthesis protein TsaE